MDALDIIQFSPTACLKTAKKRAVLAKKQAVLNSNATSPVATLLLDEISLLRPVLLPTLCCWTRSSALLCIWPGLRYLNS